MWFGPRNWLASYGTYGIDISSPTGAQQVAHAFNATFCAPGANVVQSAERYFPQRRARFLTPPVCATGAPPARPRSGASPAQQYGTNYFRQDMTFVGTAPNGVRMRGEASLDYRIGNPCFERIQIRRAPARDFAAVIGRLRSVESSITYFAPGVSWP